jgi:hypothetical protein
MAKAKQNPSHSFYLQFFKLVEQRGWMDITLPDIAIATKIKLPELMQRYGDKNAVLCGFGRYIDEQLAADIPDAAAPLKDKLFDVLMRRFDLLQPFRGGVVRLMDDVLRAPVETLLLGLDTGGALCRSMVFMMEMAGLSSSKPFHLLAGAGLKMVYFSALRTWKTDESADLSATMATLDRNLDRLLKLTRL